MLSLHRPPPGCSRRPPYLAHTPDTTPVQVSVHIFTCCCAHRRLHPCSRRLSARARGSSYARFQAVRHLGACAGCWCQAGGGERSMVEDRVGWLVGSGPGRRHTTIGAPGAGRRAELARSWHWSPLVLQKVPSEGS